jgi:NhaP-type Na+/H+ or K+/H+ antiporter
MYASSPAQGIGLWFAYIWAYNILFSIVIGTVFGFVARKLLKASEKAGLIDKHSFLAYAIALALLITGLVSLVRSDDLLACFIAGKKLCGTISLFEFLGNSFTWDDYFRVRTQEAHFQPVLDMLINCTFFICLGSLLPWSSFASIGIGRLLGLSSLVLLFRRLPWVLLLYKGISEVRTLKEAIFAGWFGPIGVGAIFYAIIGLEELHSFSHHQSSDTTIPPGRLHFLNLSSNKLSREYKICGRHHFPNRLFFGLDFYIRSWCHSAAVSLERQTDYAFSSTSIEYIRASIGNSDV